MKKSILFVSLAAVPFFPFAQSANTITFRGEVAEQTCSVAVNGNASSAVVLLPTVSISDFASSATAGMTEFTVSVSGCPVRTAPRAINTVFLPSNVTASGNMANTGTATNVSLQLLDPTAPAAGFPLAGGYAAPGLKVAANNASASRNFAVRYYKENGTLTAGSVIGTVQYSISYP